MGANGSNPLLSAKKVFCSDITQLVECSAVNTEVIGSNPIIRAKYLKNLKTKGYKMTMFMNWRMSMFMLSYCN